MLHITIRDDEKRINREITADCFIGAYHIVGSKDGKDSASLIYVDCSCVTAVDTIGETLKATDRLEKKLWDAI